MQMMCKNIIIFFLSYCPYYVAIKYIVIILLYCPYYIAINYIAILLYCSYYIVIDYIVIVYIVINNCVIDGSAAKSHFTGNLIDGMTDVTGIIISKF